MAIYKEVNELLKAMDTWDKYGVSFGLFRLNKSNEKDYVPYVRYEDMVQAVTGTPHADVAPVVHAHNVSDTSFMCSNCTFADFGMFLHGGKYVPKYCPNCGAKMDEEVENG